MTATADNVVMLRDNVVPLGIVPEFRPPPFKPKLDTDGEERRAIQLEAHIIEIRRHVSVLMHACKNRSEVRDIVNDIVSEFPERL